MKPESLINLFLVISIVTICVAGIVGEMNTHYSPANNVSTAWNNYNFQDRINASVTEVSDKIDKAGEQEGYLTIVTGVSAIWSGIKSTAVMILAVPTYFLEISRGVASGMGLPDTVANVIVPLFFMMLLVLIIFMTIRLIRGDTV